MDLTKHERIGLCVFGVIIVSLLTYLYFANKTKSEIEVISKSETFTESVQKPSENGKKSEIKVYICGEVKNAGVYTLIEGDRLSSLLDMAGGFTEKADMLSVNLAAKLKDEDYIKIPEKQNPLISRVPGTQVSISGGNSSGTPVNIFSGSTSVNTGKINLNTASKDELEKLPRVGETLAQRIIDYRQQNGPFKDVKDITKVSGIGQKTFDDMKDKISVQ